MTIPIISGTVPRAQKVCVYGPEGVGKTTFASKFPKPLFLDLERGSCSYDVDRVYPETTQQVDEVLRHVLAGGTGYETVVIDSYDALWSMYAAQVAASKNVKTIDDVGYSKGPGMVCELLTMLLMGVVDRLIRAGVNVVVLAHTEVRNFSDTQHGVNYDRFQLRVHKLAAGLLVRQMDTLLFKNFDTQVIQDEHGKYRPTGGKRRALWTWKTPAADGKSRYALPEKMDPSQTAVLKILGDGMRLRHEWDEILKGFSDEQITGFLLKNGKIAEGQNWWEVDAEFVARGVANADRLKSAVEAHVASLGEAAA